MAITVNLLPQVDKRPALYTTKYPNGDRPHYSRTANGLRLTAPVDIDDTIGQYAALEIVGDAGFSFGTGPWRQIVLGCGFGYMYDNPLGTQVYDHLDPITGNLWEFERKTPDPLKWKVHEDAQGRRCMQTNDDGGNGFGHDTGAPLPDNTVVFFSRLVTATYSNPNTVENLQWKSVRLQNGLTVDSNANVTYHKTFDKEQSLSQRSTTTYYSNDGGTTIQARDCYSMHHPVHDGVPTLQEATDYNGTTDQFNGYLSTHECKPGATYNTKIASDTANIISQSGNNSGLRLRQSYSENTWRSIFFQDYYDEAASGNQTITQHYAFAQYGSAERLLVGDNANPYACNFPTHSLPVVKHPVTGLIVFPWFNALMDSLSGKWLHYFNDSGAHVGSIQVVI